MVLCLAVAATAVGWAWVRAAAKTILSVWPEHQRARALPPEPFFAQLAASQLGYAPAMQTRFSSPVAFQSFRMPRRWLRKTVWKMALPCVFSESQLKP